MTDHGDLVVVRPEGLFCPAGDFYIDAWQPVGRTLLTHAHGDHARPGTAEYMASQDGLGILARRLGDDARVHGVAYGQPIQLGRANVSFHPAGHVLGSAQIRIEVEGEIWVVTGDYKRAPDPTCAPFEPVGCDVLITEATFGLPIYRWQPPTDVVREILAWWDDNRAHGRASVLYCYALGKAQRILAELARVTDRTVFTHGTVETLTQSYREHGVQMLPTSRVIDAPKRMKWAGELVLAPPSARATNWIRRFGKHRAAFASGWMRVRGMRRQRAYDRGFTLSDHADWPALLQTVQDSGARRILVTHGRTDVLVRHLREGGYDASALATHFEGEVET